MAPSTVVCVRWLNGSVEVIETLESLWQFVSRVSDGNFPPPGHLFFLKFLPGSISVPVFFFFFPWARDE